MNDDDKNLIDAMDRFNANRERQIAAMKRVGLYGLGFLAIITVAALFAGAT